MRYKNMEKLFSKIKKETLSADEKAKIFYSLRSFVAQNPAQSIKSPFYDTWSVLRQKMFIVPTAFVFVVVLAASTIFAANNSLPGSSLYSVKMLKENVESLAATDIETKTLIEASHAISRLEEVEQVVVSSGQLDTNTRKQIENNFESRAQSVTDSINKLRDRGRMKEASKIQSDFESRLAEYEKTIKELSDKDDTGTSTKKELDNVVSGIRSQREKTSKIKEDWEKSKDRLEKINAERGRSSSDREKD